MLRIIEKRATTDDSASLKNNIGMLNSLQAMAVFRPDLAEAFMDDVIGEDPMLVQSGLLVSDRRILTFTPTAAYGGAVFGTSGVMYDADIENFVRLPLDLGDVDTDEYYPTRLSMTHGRPDFLATIILPNLELSLDDRNLFDDTLEAVKQGYLVTPADVFASAIAYINKK